MTQPRSTPAPHAAETEAPADQSQPRSTDRDHTDVEGPPATEPAADDQEIDTAGTTADPSRPTPTGEGF
jgi:hypothetical protein